MTASDHPRNLNQAVAMPSSDTGLSDRLRRLFLESLSIEVPSVDTDIIQTGLLDSLGLVELLFQIEREFQLRLSLDEIDIDQFRTLRSIGEFLLTTMPLTTNTRLL